MRTTFEFQNIGYNIIIIIICSITSCNNVRYNNIRRRLKFSAAYPRVNCPPTNSFSLLLLAVWNYNRIMNSNSPRTVGRYYFKCRVLITSSDSVNVLLNTHNKTYGHYNNMLTTTKRVTTHFSPSLKECSFLCLPGKKVRYLNVRPERF